GAGDTTLMSQVIRISFMLGLGYSSILALLFYLGREPLVAIFLTTGSSSEIQTLASFMMIGLATYVMADATILIAGGVLRGAGDTRWLMWASVLIHWLMLAVQYFVIKVWELGPKVSWVVFVAMILMTAIIYLLRLTSSRWRTPEAFARVMSEQ
ncbi:MAG: MATE family efflux transporter, partial [Gammaproteobacteria bacterium]|nr:MATE family efflux transporter [Gammaproteobacteria bacterium]